MELSEQIEKVEAVLKRLQGWCGQLVRVHESISRLRIAGHSPQVATRSHFVMRLERAALSGLEGPLVLEGKLAEGDAAYQIAIDCIQAISLDTGDKAVVIEQFEKWTERRTTIQLQEAS